MLMGMTLCHSVQYTSGHFVASSPDEQAIVEACSRAGFRYDQPPPIPAFGIWLPPPS